MQLRSTTRQFRRGILFIALAVITALPARSQVSVTSELSNSGLTSLESTDGRTGVSMRIEFGAEGAVVIRPPAGLDESIESAETLRDLLYHRAEIEVRRGLADQVASTLGELQARAGFDIDYRFERRAFALPSGLASVATRREFVLTSVAPFLFPSLSGRVFSCGKITISRPDIREVGRICLYNTSVRVVEPFMEFEEPEDDAAVPAYFVAWERQPQSNGRPYGNISTSLEWSTQYALLQYPDGDSLFVVPVADAAHTLLAVAAVSGHIGLIDLLLDSGADADAVSVDGRTPLHLATAKNVSASVERLLQAGALVDQRDAKGQTPLHVAAANGFAEIVSLLSAKGADVNRRDGDSNTPLLLAIAGGHEAAVRLLLAAGADPEAADARGVSPLMLGASASARGIAAEPRAAVVRMLLHAGVEPDRANPEGQTALHYATRPDDSEVVRILLVAGAALEAPTNDGSTALMLAAETGHRQTLRVLADAGARIEATDELGNTPLMRAAAADESRTLEDLLRRGASKRARNADGLHALGIAKAKGSGSVRRVFEHIKPIQFSYIKLGANLARLTDPQHASSVGGEFGMSVAAKVLTRFHFQLDGASMIRVTDPGEDGPVSFSGPGDFYYSIYSFEVRPQVRFTLGNPYRRHAYLLAGAGFGSVVEAELRDYSGQTDEEVVTDNTDETFTSINFGLGYEVDLTRSILTLELTYSHIPSMKVDRFEGGFDTFGFSLGLGL